MFKLSNYIKLAFIMLVVAGLSAGLYGCGLSQVPKTDRLKANLFYKLGVGYYQNGNYVKAMQEFIKAKRSNPYSAKDYNAIGMVYMMTHRKDLAVTNFKKAVSLNSKFSYAYYNLALIYMKNHDYRNAKISLKKALLDPFYDQPYESYTQLARIYIIENKLKKAEKLLLISESLGKRYFLTYYYLGEIYLIKGQLHKSLYNFKKAVNLDIFFAPARYKVGVVYFRLKRYKQAKEIFDYVHKHDGSNNIGVKSFNYLKKIRLYGY